MLEPAEGRRPVMLPPDGAGAGRAAESALASVLRRIGSDAAQVWSRRGRTWSGRAQRPCRPRRHSPRRSRSRIVFGEAALLGARPPS